MIAANIVWMVVLNNEQRMRLVVGIDEEWYFYVFLSLCLVFDVRFIKTKYLKYAVVSYKEDSDKYHDGTVT